MSDVYHNCVHAYATLLDIGLECDVTSTSKR